MPRYCFTLQVRADRLEDYTARHREVWPEMCRALEETGWRDYSLFLAADGLLVGYVVADDLAASQAAMARTEVNARWQAEMAAYFTGIDGRPPDEGFRLLEEVFHLPAPTGTALPNDNPTPTDPDASARPAPRIES